jgi:hypothetical protein
MEGKRDGGFKKKALRIMFAKPISPVQPHYPGMGRGVAE